jgi:hypothetical protein
MDKIKALFKRSKDKGTAGTKTDAAPGAAVPKPGASDKPSTADPTAAPAGAAPVDAPPVDKPADTA